MAKSTKPRAAKIPPQTNHTSLTKEHIHPNVDTRPVKIVTEAPARPRSDLKRTDLPKDSRTFVSLTAGNVHDNQAQRITNPTTTTPIRARIRVPKESIISLLIRAPDLLRPFQINPDCLTLRIIDSVSIQRTSNPNLVRLPKSLPYCRRRSEHFNPTPRPQPSEQHPTQTRPRQTQISQCLNNEHVQN